MSRTAAKSALTLGRKKAGVGGGGGVPFVQRKQPSCVPAHPGAAGNAGRRPQALTGTGWCARSGQTTSLRSARCQTRASGQSQEDRTW